MEFEWEEEPQERKGELKIGSFSLSLLRRDIRLWGLALYKKWVWIVLVPPLAGGLIFLAVTLFCGRVFEANTTLLRVERDYQKIEGAVDAFKPLSNEVVVDMIRSRNNILEVCRRLSGSNVSFHDVYDHTTITRKKSRDNLFVISARAADPKTAAELADAIAGVFLEDYKNTQKSKHVESYNNYRRNQEELKLDIENRERELKKQMEDFGGISLTEALERCSSQIRALEARQLDDRATAQAAESKLEELRKQLAATPPTIRTVSETYDEDKMEIQRKEMELAGLRMQYTDDNPIVQKAAMTLKVLKERAAVNGASQKPSKVIQGVNPTYRFIEADIVRAQSEFTAAGHNISTIGESLQVLRNQEAKIVRLIPAYGQMVAILKQKKELLGELEKSCHMQNLAANSPFCDISIYEHAAQPTQGIARRRLVLSLGGLILAFLGTAGTVLGKEALNLRVRSGDDFEAGLGVPCIGAVCELASDNRSEYYAQLQMLVDHIRDLAEKPEAMVAMVSYDSRKEAEAFVDKCNDVLMLKDIDTLRISVCSELPEKSARYLVNDYLYGLAAAPPEPDAGRTLYFKLDEMSFFTPPEPERLRMMRGELKKYDIVVWTIGKPEEDRRLFEIICESCGDVIFAARFDCESKLKISADIRALRQGGREPAVSGLLYDIPAGLSKWVV